MAFQQSLKKTSFKILKGPIKLLVKATVLPEDPGTEFGLDLDKPIYYVISHYSATDLNVLHQYCENVGLPSPLGDSETCSYIFVEKRKHFWNKTSNYQRHHARLSKILQQQKENPDANIQLIPVAISWGRNPGKEKSLFRIFLTNTIDTIGNLRKALLVIILGRQSFITFSKPFSLEPTIEAGGSQDHMTLKLTRMLRVYFRDQKTASLGPNVYNRRQLIRALVSSPEIEKVIENETRKKNLSTPEVKKLASKYAMEISSNYSYFVMRTFETALGWVLNRIYDGVKVSNAERVRTVARDYSLVYVPCHRSHMDYLLVSYVLYHQGLVPPHIAAGINLNFWPVGSYLRRGGAFFLRRSFSGNKLYSTVFNGYLNVLFNKGYSIEYFPEGGRSRTGRLLQPKTGMLSMTLENVLQGRKKPLLLVPVYLGYDKIMEGKSYLGELRGTNKKRESIGQLLGARKTLKQSFGQVHVNFGEPVCIETWLDNNQRDWRDFTGELNERPKWFTPKVRELANDLMKGINSATAVSPVTLVALVLLATPRYAIDKGELLRQLSLYLKFLKEAPYSPDLVIPDGDAEDILAAADKLNAIQIVTQAMGDIVFFSEETAVLMTYYRNNILHLFILPAMIASNFRYKRSLGRRKLKSRCIKLYPYLRKELFLHWDEQQFKRSLNSCIQFMIKEKLLTEKANKLWRPDKDSQEIRSFILLSECLQNMLKRFAIVLTLLVRQTEQNVRLTRRDLQSSSQKLAERIAILYDINAPEAFDKNIFATLINILKEQGAISSNHDGLLLANEQIKDMQQNIISMLPFSAQQQLQQVIYES